MIGFTKQELLKSSVLFVAAAASLFSYLSFDAPPAILWVSGFFFGELVTVLVITYKLRRAFSIRPPGDAA